MASSELQKRKQEEYEMQLFNFHSRAMYATLKGIVDENIHSAIEKMGEAIQKAHNLNSENLAVLKTNQKQLEKAYCTGAQPHLENIKNVVNKYIAIPSNVLLEEDKYQRIQYSDTEFENIKQRLNNLQERAKRATVLNTALKEEMKVIQQFPISEENVNKIYNMMENDIKCPNINEKIYHLIDDYKQFSSSVYGTTPISNKIKYNTINDLKCKDLDLDTL